MPEYQISYDSELDTYQLYHRYEESPPKDDWRTAALRGPALPALGNATAGAVGSAISNLITYPLSLIITRLQTQNQRSKSNKEGEGGDDDEETYTDVIDAARKIYAKEGLGSLYAGLAQDTFKTVADSFLFFLAYGFFRERRIKARSGSGDRRSKRVVLPVLDELAIGVLAGAFAKLFTTPLANIVARKQTARSNASTREIAARIRAEKGVRGFWSGYSASLILTLNPSITFFLNEFLKYSVLPKSRRGKPTPAMVFFLAAISKATASSVTYPFSMAKTRAQATSASQPAPSPGKEEKEDEGISLVPPIISNVVTIARTEGLTALYSGLTGEVAKGFFSHGFTMLAKDAVYAAIVQSYYLLLIVLRRYPTPEELIERAREQAEEWAEAAREGAKDLAGSARQGAGEALAKSSGSVAVDMSSGGGAAGVGSNETAEMVGDYVEDEAAEWKGGLYRWFGEKGTGKVGKN
ncbi:putative mitochondrial carrier protein [Aspergillus candidus]|uniref:Putative mitochondrial carrier protein n=1 Tax=Aspergillus candidus TaxID=41067 RepID=A0A2I2FAY2_ASPCN|nr:putative mitochondrial carrier protein [Aspergillus candidus]PLB37791.1 putative mitochondrial carrier protein [Aspergillus candidus]